MNTPQAHHVASWLPTTPVDWRGPWFVRRCNEGGTLNPAGLCTRLDEVQGPNCHGYNWMIDDVKSWREHQRWVEQFRGCVLISGLGIGMLPAALVRSGRCSRIDIIENAPQVIELVAGHLQSLSPIIHIIEADANEFIPDRTYDFGEVDHFPDYPNAEQRLHMTALWGSHVRTIEFWSPVE